MSNEFKPAAHWTVNWHKGVRIHGKKQRSTNKKKYDSLKSNYLSRLLLASKNKYYFNIYDSNTFINLFTFSMVIVIWGIPQIIKCKGRPKIHSRFEFCATCAVYCCQWKKDSVTGECSGLIKMERCIKEQRVFICWVKFYNNSITFGLLHE